MAAAMTDDKELPGLACRRRGSERRRRPSPGRRPDADRSETAATSSGCRPYALQCRSAAADSSALRSDAIVFSKRVGTELELGRAEVEQLIARQLDANHVAILPDIDARHVGDRHAFAAACCSRESRPGCAPANWPPSPSSGREAARFRSASTPADRSYREAAFALPQPDPATPASAAATGPASTEALDCRDRASPPAAGTAAFAEPSPFVAAARSSPAPAAHTDWAHFVDCIPRQRMPRERAQRFWRWCVKRQITRPRSPSRQVELVKSGGD